ncbi:MAG: hypothetical protein EAZ95_05315 [Bacteroidetes bacterium]|nr:MAG: hypothetical protein EAZ95_05315 [Bacteroidota bacterium]
MYDKITIYCANLEKLLRHLFVCMRRFIFLWAVFFLASPFVYAQLDDKLSFYRLPAGISNNWVSYIFQDSKGFMWFGTAKGLNRFDGYKFTIYENDSEDSTSISQGMIMHIHEDKTGNFWISTEGGGLNYFDRKTETFKRYTQGNTSKHITSPLVRMVLEDENGMLWIAHGQGLDAYNPQTKTFAHYSSLQPETNYQGGEAQTVFHVDAQYVWLTTKGGIARFDKQKKTFATFTRGNSELKDNFIRAVAKSKEKNKYWIGDIKTGISLISVQGGQVSYEKHYAHETQDEDNQGGNDVKSLLEDKQGRLWVGIENGGLRILDIKTGEFSHYKHSNKDEHSLASNSPWAIYEDNFGNVWIGSFNQGVNVVYNQYYSNFKHFYQKNGESNTLVNNNISCFWNGQDGKIWIGTDGGGISLWDRQKNNYTNYTQDSPAPLQIPANAILSVGEDKARNVWFTTWYKGCMVFDAQTRRFANYTTQNKGFATNTHFSLMSGRDGKLYMPSWEHTLDVYDVENNKVLWSRVFPDSLKYFYRIIEDSKQNIWIATANGLLLIPPQERHQAGKFKLFQHQRNQPNSLSDNSVIEIYEDSEGNIWVGTVSGLNKLNPDMQTFTVYRKKDGLVNDDIRGIIEDDQKTLWITTSKGLSKRSLKTGVFENFYQEDGLQGNEFTRWAIHKTPQGEILIGGNNGFNVFNPNKLLKNPAPPKVYLTNFKLFNKHVPIGGKDSPLKQHIQFTQEITLKHTQSVFTIEFVALNYIRPEKNAYAYILEGLEKEWNYVEGKREATYTNLPAGTYTFRVKATNNDGLWNETGVALKIIVLPPWWETIWFRGLVLCLIVGGATTFYKIRTDFLKKQNAFLEQQVQERTEEVTTQNEELRQTQEEILAQRDAIEVKNRELAQQNTQIQDSIRAAKTIQKAIVPHKQKRDDLLRDHFVIYRPRDVVSGDFYWLNQVGKETILAVIDCTGHGVPGAFMTLITNNLLDKIVRVWDIHNPSDILTRLHEEIETVLRQKETDNHYGMDMSILTITPHEEGKHRLVFVGAKHNLYYIPKEGTQIEIIQGMRKSIGGLQRQDIVFENQEIILETGSTIYLTTDGYLDQNDVKRRKIGQKQFIQLLQDNYREDMNTQKQRLIKHFYDHIRDTEQRDDILVMGVRLS